MFRRNMLLGGALLCLTACGSQATLTTDQRTYTPGSEVLLRLQNDSDQKLAFNLECWSVLQRHEGRSWTSVGSPDDVLCIASDDITQVLEPGSHAEHRRELDAALPAGEYRYAANVAWSGEGEVMVSNTFNVTRASTP